MREIRINSNYLEREVRIVIRTPKNYKEEKCNVIYFHDGNNAFFDNEATFGNAWKIHEVVANLEKQNVIKPTIIVAIDNNAQNSGMERAREFSVFDNSSLLKQINDNELLSKYDEGILKAKGGSYLKFINQELITYVEPLLECEIDTSERMMIGSSLGGLITLTCGLIYPENFKYLIGLSNAFWYCEDELVEMIKTLNPNTKQVYYLDCGTKEDSFGLKGMNSVYIESNRRINRKLKAKGFNAIFKIIENGLHHETDWAIRIEGIITDVIEGGK